MLSGIAALTLGCASHSHSQKIDSIDYSTYNFNDVIKYDYFHKKDVFFKSFYKRINLLIVADSTLKMAFQYFDMEGNDLKIDSLSVLIGGYDPKIAYIENSRINKTIEIGKVPDQIIYETYTIKSDPQIIAQMQKEFDKYLELIKKEKSTLAYQILHYEPKKKK